MQTNIILNYFFFQKNQIYLGSLKIDFAHTYLCNNFSSGLDKSFLNSHKNVSFYDSLDLKKDINTHLLLLVIISPSLNYYFILSKCHI